MNKGAVLFTNFTAADFAPTWNGVPYEIPAGQSIMLETGIAETFAKHLIDREINKMKDASTGDEALRRKLWDRIFPSKKVIKAEDETKLRHDIAAANAEKPKAPAAAPASTTKVEADAEPGAFPALQK